MSINILKNEHFHSILDRYEGPSLEEIKKNYLEEIKNLPPILARGTRDYLIRIDETLEPPILVWKWPLLEEMQIGDLILLKGLLERKQESQIHRY